MSNKERTEQILFNIAQLTQGVAEQVITRIDPEVISKPTTAAGLSDYIENSKEALLVLFKFHYDKQINEGR